MIDFAFFLLPVSITAPGCCTLAVGALSVSATLLSVLGVGAITATSGTGRKTLDTGAVPRKILLILRLRVHGLQGSWVVGEEEALAGCCGVVGESRILEREDSASEAFLGRWRRGSEVDSESGAGEEVEGEWREG